MKNNYVSLNEMLNNTHGKKKTTKPVKAAKTEKVKTKKGKKIVVKTVAIVAAAAIALSAGIAGIVNHFKKKNNDVPKKPNNSISTMIIDDMGTELEFPKNNESKYSNVTGDIDVNKIVEKNDKLYVDKESADKSKDVGKTTIDTKNDTLKVDPDGKVKEKDKGYEIKDDKGNVIDKGDLGDNGIPDGYAYDSVLKKYLPKEEVGKYVYADATYYDEEGTVIIKKGDVVAKETLEKAKKYLTTTKATKKEPTSAPSSSTTTTNPTETTTKTETTTDEGKVNANGTYTIFGLTFESKADYEQWVLQGYEGYAEADGIMKSEEEILKQMQKVK